MKNNRGFTLIEIIVSLALLSIISVGMISGLTAQFRFLTSTRNFTEDLSLAQQQMEGEIVAVKKTLEESGTPTGEMSFTLFSGAYERTVVGYPRQTKVTLGPDTRSFYTVVGSQILDFPVATATVNIKFMPINSTLFKYSSSLNATSNVSIVDPEGVLLTNIYRWYVSRPGFNIPMISTTPEEVETGTTYPRFPDDYSIIPSSSNTTLASVVSRYPGRHVLCTVTPASASGKIGAAAVSNPLFVSGLPVQTGLQLHLDASLVSRESAFNAVRESGGNYFVKNWPDISGNGHDAVQGAAARQPELVETYIGDIVDNGFWYETYAKYAAFDGSNVISTSVNGEVDDTGSLSTVFVVARDAGAGKFTIYKDAVSPAYVSFASGGGSTTVTVGGSGAAVDVAEVIVYNAVLSAGDSDAVTDYLKSKYLPETPAATIRWLNDVTATVALGESYTPPPTVPAYMTSGRYQDVPVTWNPASIDTSTAGEKYSTCAATVDPTKTATLTVRVVAPTPLAAIGDITVSNNGTYAALKAGALSPEGATATYQWQVYTDGAWQDIAGAVSSVYSTGVWGQQYQVVATGTGAYVGSVTSNPLTLTVTQLIGIAAPSVTGGGTYAQLTVGDLNPPSATADYQWQSFSSGSWHDVSGAASNTYGYASWGSQYRVMATGTGAYYGTVYSAGFIPTQRKLDSIADIAMYWNGTRFILTAGAVDPPSATVTYQWQYRSSGSWHNISGATTSTYTATQGTTYRVLATGTGMYTGTVTSKEITAEKKTLDSIGNITVTWDGNTPILTAGAVLPSGATADYQWQYRSSGNWHNIGGARDRTYTGTMGTQYRVTATGTGAYYGTVNSESVTPNKISLTGIGNITVSWVGGSPVLTAGAVLPSGATFTYQWQQYSSDRWQNISGATSSSYTGTAGTQYQVQAIGTGAYSGTVTSNGVTPRITPLTGIGNITVTWPGGSPVLTAGAVLPSGATFTYQWQYYRTSSPKGWTDISGASERAYTGTAGTQYQVQAIGTGAYSGTVTSIPVTPNRIQVTAVGPITRSSYTLSPGAVSPPSATVTYEWQRHERTWIFGWSDWSNWSTIGTGSTCTYTGNGLITQYQYQLIVTGTGQYYGSATSQLYGP